MPARTCSVAASFILLGAWCTGIVALEPVKPMLEVMYLKCNEEPIDTTPVFTPAATFYKVNMDWKMNFFSVEARPVHPAVIDNVHLCPQNADCTKQDQIVATMEFARNIIVPPGATVRYHFDVLLEGITCTYTIIAHRREGTETNIRHMVLQGATLYPEFSQTVKKYRSKLPVTMELASLELHLQDSGQTILASADAPLLLERDDNISKLRNNHPGNTRSPPMRLRLRRLRERDYGEFQYPNKYLEFPVPLASKRLVSFKVRSADGGHFGYYSLELARSGCKQGQPLFDATERRCVNFCNMGFWADLEDHRCKRCRERCLSCLSLDRCLRCPLATNERSYVLDNNSGSCIERERHLWEQHPEHTAALAAAVIGLSVFLCGLCLFCLQHEERRPTLKEPAGVPVASGAVPSFSSKGRGRGPASSFNYMPVNGYDLDDD